MAAQQPVEDRTVDDVQNNFDVIRPGDITSLDGLLDQAAAGFAARQDHLVAERLGHFAFRIGRRQCHGDLSTARRRESFDQRSHLHGQAGLQGTVLFGWLHGIGHHQRRHGEFAGIRPVSIDRRFPDS